MCMQMPAGGGVGGWEPGACVGAGGVRLRSAHVPAWQLGRTTGLRHRNFALKHARMHLTASCSRHVHACMPIPRACDGNLTRPRADADALNERVKEPFEHRTVPRHSIASARGSILCMGIH